MTELKLNELKKMETRLLKLSEYANNKKIGYEPKCKICNSKYQNEVEALREDGYTLEEIRDYLRDNGENVSLMSISRHFDRHYPTRKAYLNGISEEKARAITEGEKVIEEDLKYNPEFIEELEKDQIYMDTVNGEFKELKEKGRDIYIFKYGYCLTASRFCHYVPKLKQLLGFEVSDYLRTEIFKINEGLVSDFMGEKKIKLLENSLECTQCQVDHNNWTTQGLLSLIIFDKYGVNIELDKFNKFLFEVDFIPEYLRDKLSEYASRERVKV